MPGYATIGMAAPVLVLIGRLLQGFSAGVELGGVSVYLSEMATPGHKGFYVGLAVGQPAGGHHGRRGASAIVLNATLTPAEVAAWGWRMPFFIGCLIVPFLFYIRRSLQETEEFRAAQAPSDRCREIFASLAAQLARSCCSACCWWR